MRRVLGLLLVSGRLVQPIPPITHRQHTTTTITITTPPPPLLAGYRNGRSTPLGT